MGYGPRGAGSRTGPELGGGVTFAEIPQSVKDDITGFAGLVAVPILSLLQAIDPYCAGALADNLDPVMTAALPLICKSSRVVAYFASEGSDWLLWGKLAIALRPVGEAIVEHHILSRVRIERDPATGARVAVPNVRRPGGLGDPLVPPVPPAEPYQYAA